MVNKVVAKYYDGSNWVDTVTLQERIDYQSSGDIYAPRYVKSWHGVAMLEGGPPTYNIDSNDNLVVSLSSTNDNDDLSVFTLMTNPGYNISGRDFEVSYEVTTGGRVSSGVDPYVPGYNNGNQNYKGDAPLSTTDTFSPGESAPIMSINVESDQNNNAEIIIKSAQIV